MLIMSQKDRKEVRERAWRRIADRNKVFGTPEERERWLRAKWLSEEEVRYYGDFLDKQDDIVITEEERGVDARGKDCLP